MNGGRLLTLHDVTVELRCSIATVRRRIAAGELPAFVDGRLVRVREEDLRRYVLERVHRRAGASAPVMPAGHTLRKGERLWD